MDIPMIIFWVVFISVLIVLKIWHRSRIPLEERRKMSQTGKFKFSVFIPLVLIFLATWFGMSAYFDHIAESANSTAKDGRCDVCGEPASYEIVSDESFQGEKTLEKASRLSRKIFYRRKVFTSKLGGGFVIPIL